MNVIDTGHGVLLFNVFRVRPENQRALADAIRTGGDPGALPGLVSMNVLRSEDGTHVINQMYWESRAALDQAVATSPAIAATRKAVSTLIEGTGPLKYEVLPVAPESP